MNIAAVIIESRPVYNLGGVIIDHMRYLPEGTNLYAFVPKDAPMMHLISEERIFSMYYHNVKNINDYNRILTSADFWELFEEYDRVLIFQSDSRILRKGIEEFYEWDYIGASWTWNKDFAGNGGLSLRNPKIMLEITKRYPWNGHINEDHWLTMHMHNFKIGRLAPIEVADKFSVEAKYIFGSWGFHAVKKWLTPAQAWKIKNQYLHPEEIFDNAPEIPKLAQTHTAMRTHDFLAWDGEKIREEFAIMPNGEILFAGEPRPDWVLIEYTGIRDITGQFLYTGDVCENGTAQWEVVFNKGCFCGKRIGEPEQDTYVALRAIQGLKKVTSKYYQVD